MKYGLTIEDNQNDGILSKEKINEISKEISNKVCREIEKQFKMLNIKVNDVLKYTKDNITYVIKIEKICNNKLYFKYAYNVTDNKIYNENLEFLVVNDDEIPLLQHVTLAEEIKYNNVIKYG